MSLDILFHIESDGAISTDPSTAIAVLIREDEGTMEPAHMEISKSAVIFHHPLIALTTKHGPDGGTFPDAAVACSPRPLPFRLSEIIAFEPHPTLDLEVIILKTAFPGRRQAERAELPADNQVEVQGFGGTRNQPPTRPPTLHKFSVPVTSSDPDNFYLTAINPGFTHGGDSGSPVFLPGDITRCCGLLLAQTIGGTPIKCIRITDAVVEWMRKTALAYNIDWDHP